MSFSLKRRMLFLSIYPFAAIYFLATKQTKLLAALNYLLKDCITTTGQVTRPT